MNNDTARSLLSDAIGDGIQLEDAPKLGETKGWDSIAHMRLILALEEKIGRQLNPNEMLGLETLDDIAALL